MLYRCIDAGVWCLHAKVNVLRQASVTIWFPSSHSSPCWDCTFPSPHTPILSWTFSVDWNDWKGWKKTERNNIWGPLVATSCVTNQTRPNQKDICLNWKQYVSRELRLLPVWASIRLYPWSTAPSDPFWILLHWPDARAPSLPRCSPQRSTRIHTCRQQTVKQGFSIATCIQYGLIGAGSYCGDFIKRAPVGVASKGSIVGDLGITFAVARWTWDTHFPLFPNWKKACEGNNRTQCCRLWYTTNSDLWEHLW